MHAAPAQAAASAGTMIAPHIHGLRTDEEFGSFMRESKKKTVLVEFGSSWCAPPRRLNPASA
jgi:hypothetical protein